MAIDPNGDLGIEYQKPRMKYILSWTGHYSFVVSGIYLWSGELRVRQVIIDDLHYRLLRGYVTI